MKITVKGLIFIYTQDFASTPEERKELTEKIILILNKVMNNGDLLIKVKDRLQLLPMRDDEGNLLYRTS
jgi:hypothetical protein